MELNRHEIIDAIQSMGCNQFGEMIIPYFISHFFYFMLQSSDPLISDARRFTELKKLLYLSRPGEQQCDEEIDYGFCHLDFYFVLFIYFRSSAESN